MSQENVKSSINSVNIKISCVSIKMVELSKSNLILKLQLNNSSIPYYTECLPANPVMVWKDKSFYFLNATEWSTLKIEIYDEKEQSFNPIAQCKVYIINLI